MKIVYLKLFRTVKLFKFLVVTFLMLAKMTKRTIRKVIGGRGWMKYKRTSCKEKRAKKIHAHHVAQKKRIMDWPSKHFFFLNEKMRARDFAEKNSCMEYLKKKYSCNWRLPHSLSHDFSNCPSLRKPQTPEICPITLR